MTQGIEISTIIILGEKIRHRDMVLHFERKSGSIYRHYSCFRAAYTVLQKVDYARFFSNLLV